jgi:hypothetical protein
MGDNDRSSTLHHLLESCLHLPLALFIQGASSFVQQEDVRLANDCACNSDTLLLAAGQL